MDDVLASMLMTPEQRREERDQEQRAKIYKLEQYINKMDAVATAQEFADWLTNEGIVLDYGSNVGRESVGDAFIRFLGETAALASIED
jgi:hypothetical protein